MKAAAVCVILLLASQGVAQQRPAAQCVDSTRLGESYGRGCEFVDLEVEPQEQIPFEKLVIYPDSARANKIEGEVTLDILVAKDGQVVKTRILRATNSIFVKPALDAAKAERFTPARQNGQPLKIWVTRKINFNLQ